MNLIEELRAYQPFNEQEEKDRELILRCLETMPDVYERSNPIAHMTASAWIVNPERTKVLMCWHNIYKSWSWLGGHADGERDLLKVALKETREESGLKQVIPVSDQIFSIESLTVDGHIHHGIYVSSHLHLNATYLLEADNHEMIHMNPEENSGVSWFPLEEAVRKSSEPWFREHIYSKLNEKLKLMQNS